MNCLILIVFLASAAFASDDGLEEAAQFFDKAYTTALHKIIFCAKINE